MGRPLAIVGLTSNDEPIGIEDFRDGPGEPQGDPRLFTGRMRPRPLQLEDAKARASRTLGVQVRAARYEHFSHNAETGVAVLRPLVALDTDQGVVYVNSRGQAFVDSAAPLARSRGVAPSPGDGRAGPSNLILLADLPR